MQFSKSPGNLENYLSNSSNSPIRRIADCQRRRSKKAALKLREDPANENRT